MAFATIASYHTSPSTTMDAEPDVDDLWQDFPRPRSLRSLNPPIFVPASNLHSTRDDDDDHQGSNVDGDAVATWYRSLSRQTTSPDNSPAPAASLKAPPGPGPSSTPRRSHDWFISRAISREQYGHHTAAASAPHPTLADLLSRNPPSAARPLRPPVFLHLGPSNKGWAILENQGWSEGEGLGSSSAHRSDARPPTKFLPPPPPPQIITKTGSPLPLLTGTGTPSAPSSSSSPEMRISEVRLGDDDDIVELRKVPVIDLTLSDSDSNSDSDDVDADADDYGYEDEGDDDADEDPRPSSSPPSSDPRAESTVLLTPLPTVLKSDRLGIGLKAKTEGPYRSSVKRVTHNAAALAAHVKASEELRLNQHRFGRGRRAYTRAEHVEREHRQEMMAYLNGP